MPRRNPPWIRDEVILALDLYFRRDPRRTSRHHKEITALSSVLRSAPLHKDPPSPGSFRNADSIYMKLCNFPDVEYPGKWLSSINRLDREVCEAYRDRRDTLHAIAEAIKTFLLSGQLRSQSPEDDLDYAEGTVLLRVHRNHERAGQKELLGRAPCLDARCETCGLSADVRYGEVGSVAMECHHLIPLSSLRPGQQTRPSDPACLCSNCHRVTHTGTQSLTVSQLKELVHSRLSHSQPLTMCLSR
jgi:5-methylcytosine-specific restriction protein A